MLVDELRQRPADAAHLHQIVYARAQYALESPELLQELTPTRWSKTWNGLERRYVVTLCSAPAMADDRKSMCFVADALDQVQ